MASIHRYTTSKGEVRYAYAGAMERGSNGVERSREARMRSGFGSSRIGHGSSGSYTRPHGTPRGLLGRVAGTARATGAAVDVRARGAVAGPVRRPVAAVHRGGHGGAGRGDRDGRWNAAGPDFAAAYQARPGGCSGTRPARTRAGVRDRPAAPRGADPRFLTWAEVEELASYCQEHRLIVVAALSGLVVASSSR